MKTFGIYAHRNKLTNEVFYVGQQRKNNSNNLERAFDFSKHRNKKYDEYVKNIGFKNIEVIWLYKTNDENEKLHQKEKMFQEIYHNIYKEKFLTTELLLHKENNPNYGNKWTEEKKKALSEKKKSLKQSVGDKNGMARSCILYGPNNEQYEFTTLKEMRQWFKDNVVDGDTVWPPENEYKEKNVKYIRPSKRDAYYKAIGWYYKKK